jgi:hypothetical protein
MMEGKSLGCVVLSGLKAYQLFYELILACKLSLIIERACTHLFDASVKEVRLFPAGVCFVGDFPVSPGLNWLNTSRRHS